MQRYYDGMRAWGAVVSAVAAICALSVAVVALLVARHNYDSSIAEAKNKIAADTLLEWARRQPLNTRPCLELMAKFETADWNEIAARHEVQLTPTTKEGVLACFSDLSRNELPELYDQSNNKLTRRGASLVAQRANQMLSADNFVASFMVHNIGNIGLYTRVGEAICQEDRTIIERLPNIPSITASFASIRQYIALPKPNGCS
jgi:hypothetical protein